MNACRTAVRLALLTLIASWSTISLAADTAWPAPEWQTATPESQGMNVAAVEKLGEWLKAAGSKTGLVVRHGRIVGEWYFGDAKPDSKYLVYSTTKSFASTAAGIVVADGKLSLDTKIGDVLSDVGPGDKKHVTLRQIISMTTGVHNDKEISNKPNLFTYALTEAPMDFKPGEKWDYNNTGLALLSPMVKKATGKQLDEIMNQRVFQPIGISASDWSWDQREGYPLSYSGLHITARSLARFGLLALNHGKWQDKQVLPEGWIKQASSPSQDLNKSYGFLWWDNAGEPKRFPGCPDDAYAALGKNDNSMLIVPNLDLIVLRQVGDYDGPAPKIKLVEFFKMACDACQK